MTYAEEFEATTERIRRARIMDETAGEWRRELEALRAIPLTEDFIQDREQGFFARAREEGRWF